jgi:hypothetical protein
VSFVQDDSIPICGQKRTSKRKNHDCRRRGLFPQGDENADNVNVVVKRDKLDGERERERENESMRVM